MAGFGHIAVHGHIPAYHNHENVEIVAVCDRDLGRKEICAELLPQARFYSSLEELLLQEVQLDFLDIAVPPNMHMEYICLALQHNMHVFCEKPLVLEKKDLQKIQTLLQQNKNKVLFTVHNWKFAPIFMQTDQWLSQKLIGSVQEIQYQVLRTQPSIAVANNLTQINWRLDPTVAGGGILMDHGWHAFYKVCDWMGVLPQWVECRLEKRKYQDFLVEDTASCQFGFGDGRVGTVFFTWAGSERKNYVMLRGQSGSIEIQDDTLILTSEKSNQKLHFKESLSQGSHHADWYSLTLNKFFEEIQNPVFQGCNFREASTVFQMLESARISAQQNGKQVEIKNSL